MRVFLEAGKLRAVLIKEGISANNNKWTRQVLEQVAKLSNGVPVHFYDMSKEGDSTFGHHWEALRQKLPKGIQRLLPEKLPGSQVGVVRNAVVEDDTNGLAQVVGDIEPSKNSSWFLSLVESLIQSGKRMGVSIFVPERGITVTKHANGVSEPTEVTEIVSYDAVSFPSAGGQLMPALEALGQPVEGDRMKFKNLIKRLRSLVPKDKRQAFDKTKAPDVKIDTVAGLLESDSEWADALLDTRGMKVEGNARAPFLEALVSTTAEDITEPKTDPGKTGRTNPEPKTDPATIEAVTREEFAKLGEVTKNLVKTASFALLEGVIGASKLPKAYAELARTQFTSIIETSGVIEKSAVEKFTTELKKAMGDATNPTLETTQITATLVSSADEFRAAFKGLYANEDQWVGEGDKKKRIPRYTSIRRAYSELTGDVYCDGKEFYIKNHGKQTGLMEGMDLSGDRIFQEYRAFKGGALEAANPIVNSMFTLINSEELHQAVLRDYSQLQHQWKLVADTENVTDFKIWHYHRFGEFPNLPAVDEADPYLDTWAGTGPEEEEITLQITKRGGTFGISWEMILNDMTSQLQKYPGKIARAAGRTLNEEVFEIIVDNTETYEPSGLVLGHATHNNLQAVAGVPTLAVLKNMRRDMSVQRDIGSSILTTGHEQGRVRAKTVFVGTENYDAMYELLFSDGIPILTTTGEPGFTVTAAPADPQQLLVSTSPNQPNVLRSKWGIGLAEAVQSIDDGDSDMYFMAADPAVSEMLKVGFLKGREEPELFLQDMQTVGTFFDNDTITHKVRHVYDVAIADFRGFQINKV